MNITEIEAKWLNNNISKIDFLNVLTPQQVIQLTNQVTSRIILGDQPVINEGEEGTAFFLIFNGMVSVWVERNGQQLKLATLKTGQYFGEISLLSGKPTTADVVANVPTKVFFLNTEQFLSMVKANENLAKHITEVMEKRLAAREKEIEELMNCNYLEIDAAIKDFLKN